MPFFGVRRNHIGPQPVRVIVRARRASRRKYVCARPTAFRCRATLENPCPFRRPLVLGELDAMLISSVWVSFNRLDFHPILQLQLFALPATPARGDGADCITTIKPCQAPAALTVAALIARRIDGRENSGGDGAVKGNTRGEDALPSGQEICRNSRRFLSSGARNSPVGDEQLFFHQLGKSWFDALRNTTRRSL